MFSENYIINGIIHCESGIHIGNPSNDIDIEGVDNPIIRDPISRLPYIPGSSIKGKLRALLELCDEGSANCVIDNNGLPSNDLDCIASQIFGVSLYGKNYPTRVIVRDSYPTDDTILIWKKNDDLYDGVELKYENIIDRIRAYAAFRSTERIPRGSEFNFEIIFSLYDGDDEKNFLYLLKSLQLLEDNYLGGFGTRGYGKIKFKNLKITKRDKEYYISGVNKKNPLEFKDIDSLLKVFIKALEG